MSFLELKTIQPIFETGFFFFYENMNKFLKNNPTTLMNLHMPCELLLLKESSVKQICSSWGKQFISGPEKNLLKKTETEGNWL